MVFGRKKDAAIDGEAPLDSYDVTYQGGLAALPKAKIGKIKFAIFPDRFELTPTVGSQKFWEPLTISYTSIRSVELADRTVSTFEGLAGGLNSRQLNQRNNIHIDYDDAHGPALLRLEMLTGVTVMGQARKCLEIEDRLRTNRITEKFAGTDKSATPDNGGDLSSELAKLGELHARGLLTDEEFTAAKSRLLA